MTKRIFRSISLVALTVFLASVILIMGMLYDYFSHVQQNQLHMQTNLAAQAVNNEGADYFDDFEARDFRITWIGTDGTVLYDSESDSGSMENHLEREEIQQAFATGYGESARYSATLMERSLYSAQRLDDGTVLRLSVAQNTALTLVLGMLQPILLVFFVAIALSMFLASRLSKKIIQPLNELDLDAPLSNDQYDEISPLLRRIDSQQKQLRFQAAELRQKRDELEAVTESMNEGLVLLNQKGRILSINRAAADLLETDRGCIGEDFIVVSRDLELQELLSKAMDGVKAEKLLTLREGQYQLDASPVVSNGAVVGVALLIFDVTEKISAEQMRREFTANVSHELKTPLHSISGYAELLENGLVKEEDVRPFAGKIYVEAQRMVRLVEDIISLSHLDEGAEDMKARSVDLYQTAEAVLRSLESAAASAKVKLDLSGGHVCLQGVEQLLESIIYNLCDNAIKYNKENGSVDVTVSETDSCVVLTVRDTGIGIPPEDQSRIFERFYRVDKSHSKEVGGTGLGLSIVKHAVMVHNAQIELRSNLGEGTVVTVRFPGK